MANTTPDRQLPATPGQPSFEEQQATSNTIADVRSYVQPVMGTAHPPLGNGIDSFRKDHASSCSVVKGSNVRDIGTPAYKSLLIQTTEPGVNIIAAPNFDEDVENFKKLKLYDNAIAVDDFVLSMDQGESQEHECIRNGHGETIELPDDRRIFGHHAGERFSQRAACLQMFSKIIKGKFRAFQRNGNFQMNLWCNRRPDEDVASCFALAKIFKEFYEQHGKSWGEAESQMNAKELREFIAAESAMDVWAGADITVSEEMRMCLKKIFLPLKHVMKNFQSATSEQLLTAFEQVTEGIKKFMNGDRTGIPLQTEFVAEKHAGWSFVKHADADARPEIRKAGHNLVLFPINKNVYSIAFWKQGSLPFMKKLYMLLNIAERKKQTEGASVESIVREFSREQHDAPGIPWGGDEVGGCIPRGTFFTTEELSVIMDNAVKEATPLLPKDEDKSN